MATIPERELEDVLSADGTASLSCDNEPPSSETITQVRLFWEHRQPLFRSVIYGLILSTIVAFLIPKQYESSTLLMPPDDQSNSGLAMAAALTGKLNGGLAGIAGDVLGLKSSGDLFIGILKSRTVLDDIISKFDLKKVYGERDLQSARHSLIENTAISEDHKSGIITITVTDKAPQRAAAMAQEYVSELNVVVNQLSTSSAHRERVFLEERLAQVKADLESAEKDFSQFASKNGTIDIKEQGRAMVEGAATVEGQLIGAQSELQGLKQIYADNNVRVRSVEARIAELKSQLQQLNGNGNEDTTSNGSKVEGDYPSIRKLPLLGVPYTDLYRRTMVEEAVFESLTQEYELAKVAEAKEIPSVRVLDPANIPEHKSFPPRLTVIAIGAFFFLMCSALWVWGQARWDELPADDPQKVFVRDVISVVNVRIPWVPKASSRAKATKRKIWLQLARRRDNSRPI